MIDEMKPHKTPVSKRALLQRVNRNLKPGRQVKATRGAQALKQLGEFYLIDPKRGVIVRHRLDLEEFAREIGALALWEELAR